MNRDKIKQDIPSIAAEIMIRGQRSVYVHCFNGRNFMDELYKELKLKIPQIGYSSSPHSFDSQYGEFNITYEGIFASREKANYIADYAKTYFLDKGFEVEICPREQPIREGESAKKTLYVKRDYYF